MVDLNALPATTTEGPGAGLLGDPANLVAILWRGRRLIGMCVLGSLLLGAAYLISSPKLYQATAKLLVLQQGGRPLNVGNTDQGRASEGPDDYIPTHAMVIKSRIVVGRAIESIGLRNLPSLAPTGSLEKALREVDKNLTVTRPDRQAKILQVDYRALSREEAVRLVDAITASYRAFLEEVYQKNNSEVVYLMTKARDDLNGELKELERKYLEFRQETPLLTSDGTGRPLIARRVEEWNRATSETEVRAIQLKAQLEAGQKLAEQGIGLWSISYAMDQLGGAANLGLRTQAFTPAAPSDFVRQLNQEQQRLATLYGPQNTKSKEIQEQISEVLVHARSARNRIERSEIGDLLGSIEQSLRSIESMRLKMNERFDKDLAVARKTELALLADANLRSNLERQRTIFNTVVDQLKQAKLVGDFSSTRSHTIESANALPKPVRPLNSLTMAIALVVGLVVGTGAALVSDLLDPRVRTIDEMRRVLRLPILGHVGQVPEAPAPRPRSLGLICHAMPRSPTAEAYKVARANLDLARRNRDIVTVLVTSPHASEGKSTVASNLAICLAQAGRRVLLVDADLRHPEQHAIHGLLRERGLVHVLRDLMPLHRVIQPTTIKNLDLMSSGPEATANR